MPKIKLCLYSTLGLIIDAFGELRDQQEQVKEDMEVSVSLLDSAFLVLYELSFFTAFAKNNEYGRKGEKDISNVGLPWPIFNSGNTGN